MTSRVSSFIGRIKTYQVAEAMLRLKRDENRNCPSYTTRDGQFRIWREPFDVKRWYINWTLEGITSDAIIDPSGFETLQDAKKALEKFLGRK